MARFGESEDGEEGTLFGVPPVMLLVGQQGAECVNGRRVGGIQSPGGVEACNRSCSLPQRVLVADQASHPRVE